MSNSEKDIAENVACPFCSSVDLQVVDADLDLGYFCFCCDCEAHGPLAQTQIEAFDLWQTRPLYDDIGSGMRTFRVKNRPWMFS